MASLIESQSNVLLRSLNVRVESFLAPNVLPGDLHIGRRPAENAPSNEPAVWSDFNFGIF